MRLFFISVFLISSVILCAQDINIKEGDQAFKNMQYQTAIEKYVSALSKADDADTKNKILFKLSEAYTKIKDPKSAKETYVILAENGYADINTIVWLKYGNVLLSTGNYEEAITAYRNYLKDNPSSKQAQNGIKSAEIAIHNNEEAPYIIKNFDIANTVYDDFAPIYSSRRFDAVIFTSNRPESAGKEMDESTGQYYSDMFEIEKDRRSKEWGTPESIDLNEVVNTEANEGSSSMDARYRYLYFTRCENKSDQSINCGIFKSMRRGRTWGDPEVIFQEENANYGHPTVNKREMKLIFSSNRGGGYGGKDLWMATRSSRRSDFTDIVNLGNWVNTQGDEVFPVLVNDTILYFASDGHPGFGGLDIFYSVFQKGKWTEPENVLPPINSFSDDFGITFDRNMKRGFFSSNRPGGEGRDDIYAFVKREMKTTVTVLVKDLNTKKTLPNVSLYLYRLGRDSILKKTGDDGRYRFDYKDFSENNKYEMLISKSGYFSDKKSISTFGLTENQDLFFEVFLVPVPEKPIVLPEVRFDYNSYEINPDYIDSLNSLINVLERNPNFVIELSAHTDSRNTKQYNLDLSEKRARSVVRFLMDNGIDSARLIPKGYGENKPRVLDKYITVSDDLYFKIGTRLTSGFIDSLESEDAIEMAHQLNRRIEFKVVSKDYKPKVVKVEQQVPGTFDGEIKDIIRLNGQYGKYFSIVEINGYEVSAVINPGFKNSVIGYDLATTLLKNKTLAASDFQGEPAVIFANKKIKNDVPVLIKTTTIGENKIENFKFVYKEGLRDKMVIGRDLLGKLGPFQMDMENEELLIYE